MAVAFAIDAAKNATSVKSIFAPKKYQPNSISTMSNDRYTDTSLVNNRFNKLLMIFSLFLTIPDFFN